MGIAVFDLERAISDYSALFEFDDIERLEVSTEGLKIAMLKTANSEIELLCPTSERSSVSSFLREKGEGIHHLALRVPNVAEAIERGKAIGMRVLDDKPRRAAREAEAAFVHPRSFHGVLLEFYSN